MSTENKIPTAKSFIKKNLDNLIYINQLNTDEINWIEEALIEFAKLHVEQALKNCSNIDFENITHIMANDYEEALELTIQECYSLENIK